MSNLSTFDPEKLFPLGFFPQLIQALQNYGRFLPAYLMLSVATYFPFVLLDELTSFDSYGVSGFLTARFFDVVVFISIPFLVTNNYISVKQVLQLFFQRFFGKIVLVCLIQFSFIFLAVGFFASINISLLFLGFFAYLFILFAGLFMVFYSVGQDRLPPIPLVVVNSFLLVRNHFGLVFRNILLLSIYAAFPTLVFLFGYSANIDGLDQVQDFNALVSTLLQDPGLKWGMVAIQTIVRPFESLFLGFLFLGILSRDDKEKTFIFFWGPNAENTEGESPSDFDETKEQD